MSWRATRRTIPNVEESALRIAHLYADEMNIYGDRGNILTLAKRAQWRGGSGSGGPLRRGAAPGLFGVDLPFCGGGPGPGQRQWVCAPRVTMAKTGSRASAQETSSEPTCTAPCCRRTPTSPTFCCRERYVDADFPVWNRWMTRWKCRRIAACVSG